MSTLPKAPMSLRRPIPARPEDFFSAEEVARSKKYQRPLQYARIASTLISLAAIIAFIQLRWAQAAIDSVAPSAAWPIQLLVVAVAFLLVSWLAGLPIDLWTEFGHEKKWGFSTQTPGRFAMDQVKTIVLSTVLLSVLLIPLWALIRTTELWWIWGAAVFTVFTVLLVLLLPVLILPIFNKFTPLEDESLRSKLMNLASKAGVSISGYQVMDASKRTRKDNAFFAGMGATRRVVVFDNLLEMPHENVEVVVAHEIGHWRRGHLKKQIAWGVLTSLALFAIVSLVMEEGGPLLEWAGVERPGDPAALPVFLLAFSVVSAATGILSAWISRWFEREADLDALELSERPEAYASLWRNMTERNLPDLDPSWWARIRASHPPIAERIAFAEIWTSKRSKEPI